MRAAATALALLLPALAPAQELAREGDAELKGRVSAAVSAGGGYRSDLYLGAGLPGQGLATASPTLGLDLSMSPWLKLFAELDGDAEHTFTSSASAFGLYGDALLQFRPLPWLYPEVLAAGQQDWFLGLAEPTDPGLPSSPTATRSRQFTGGAGLRSVNGPLEARLLAVAGNRISEGLDRFVETPYSATAYLGYQPLERLHLGLQYRLGRTISPLDELDFWGQELALSAIGALAPGPTLRLTASGRRNSFSLGGEEWVGRTSLSAAQRLWGGLSLEAAYRLEAVTGPAYDAPALLHSAYLGVRAEGGPWRF